MNRADMRYRSVGVCGAVYPAYVRGVKSVGDGDVGDESGC